MRHLPLAIAVLAIEVVILYLFLDVITNYTIIEGQIDWTFIANVFSLGLVQCGIFSTLVAYGSQDTTVTVIYEDEDEDE